MDNVTNKNTLLMELDTLMANTTDDLLLMEFRRIKRNLANSDWQDLTQSYEYLKKPASRLVELGYAYFKENMEIVYSHFKDLPEQGAAEVDRLRIVTRFRELLADPEITNEMKVLVEYIKRGLLKIAHEDDPVEVKFKNLRDRLSTSTDPNEIRSLLKDMEELKPFITDL